MKKIAILGCENSHADQFLGFIQNDPRYADAEVVGIYSEEADAAARLAEKYRVNLLDRPDAAVGAGRLGCSLQGSSADTGLPCPGHGHCG